MELLSASDGCPTTRPEARHIEKELFLASPANPPDHPAAVTVPVARDFANEQPVASPTIPPAMILPVTAADELQFSNLQFDARPTKPPTFRSLETIVPAAEQFLNVQPLAS